MSSNIAAILTVTTSCQILQLSGMKYCFSAAIHQQTCCLKISISMNIIDAKNLGNKNGQLEVIEYRGEPINVRFSSA